jgi:hypothetical protein
VLQLGVGWDPRGKAHDYGNGTTIKIGKTDNGEYAVTKVALIPIQLFN